MMELQTSLLLLDHSSNHNSNDDERQQLPFEIVEEILLQLPVKSLLRFKSVCKPWLALISDPKFINSHLLYRSTKQSGDDDDDEDDDGKSSKTTTTSSSKALVMLASVTLLQSLRVQVRNTTTSSNIDVQAAPLPPPDAMAANTQSTEEKAEESAGEVAPSSTTTTTTTTTTSTRVVEEAHHYPETAMRSPLKDMKIIGSHNGLLCLVLDAQHFIIYNPSTRQLQPLPAPPSTIPGKDYFYGFGYDSRNHDCKIVRATSSGREGSFTTHLDIFSMKNNTWRAATKTLPFYFLFNVVATLLNGALHWVVRRGNSSTDNDGDDERPFSIVSFDLSDETYRQVALPKDGDKNFSFYGLGVLGGRLSMLHSPHGCDYEVWLMNEYGSKASWSIFTTLPQKMESEYLGLMSLVTVLNNGEIMILLHQRKLVIYNPLDRQFRTVFSGDDVQSSQVALYLESLLSPSYLNNSTPTAMIIK